MVVWTLAKKDLLLLLRDARAMIVLLAMPLIFILVLGVSLGEGFGKKAEDTLRISVHGLELKGYLDDKLMLEHTLTEPVSGKIGVWSKTDSMTEFDDFTVTLTDK